MHSKHSWICLLQQARQSHNPLDGWPQKERQADITFTQQRFILVSVFLRGSALTSSGNSNVLLHEKRSSKHAPVFASRTATAKQSNGSKQNSTVSAKYNPHISSQHYFKISINLTLKTTTTETQRQNHISRNFKDPQRTRRFRDHCSCFNSKETKP